MWDIEQKATNEHDKQTHGHRQTVVTSGKGVRREVDRGKSGQIFVDGNLTLDGEHAMHFDSIYTTYY